MQFYIFVWASACVLASATIIRPYSSHEIPLIRRRMSYSTNVLHQNPMFSNTQAYSNVKFNLPNGNSNLKAPRAISGQTAYSPVVYTQRRPKTSEDFSIQPALGKPGVPRSIAGNHQNFNVGYSLSLTNGKPQKHSRHNFELGEIITGSPKDSVGKPSNGNQQHFSLNKAPKIFGDSSKQLLPATSNDNALKLFAEANLSQKTQKYFPSVETKTTQIPKSWRNLSPSVEIYQSRELPLNHKFTTSEIIDQSNKFDHQKAIGRSQGFDYSNVIDGQFSDTSQNNIDLFNSKVSAFAAPSNYNQFSASPILGKEKNSERDFSNYQINQDILLPKLQFDTSAFTQTTFPQFDVAFQNTPQFPLDTTLLKNAIMKSNHNQNEDTKSLPPNIDMSILKQFSDLSTEQNVQAANTGDFSSKLPQADYTNFQQQKMLHFNNEEKIADGVNNQANINNNEKLNAHIQPLHGFRQGLLSQDTVGSHSQRGVALNTKPETFDFNFNKYGSTLRENNMKVELQPPPFTARRLRFKNSRHP